MMKKLSPLLFIFSVCFFLSAASQKKVKKNSSAEVVANNATHIARITGDSIVVISGATYSFTVDTPEDSGLVQTTPNAKQLLAQIISADGSKQQYKVRDKAGVVKKNQELESGDLLEVTAQDEKSKKTYRIEVQRMALSGRLELDRKEQTVNTRTDITLYFTAGQRTPNAMVEIYFPPGITITEENTTVNLIGRGAVRLKDLSKQSIGRIGNNYSYKKVGNFEIARTGDGRALLTFRHLDLRPANGPDILIVVKDVSLTRLGNYFFKANYTTSKPEILTSAGTGSETATLTVTRTIADFERVLDKSLRYKETPSTYTNLSFRWSSLKSNVAISLLQSIDQGKTWTTSSASIDPKNATASVYGLIRDKLYSFKLFVKEGEHKGFSNILNFFSGKMDIKRFGVKGDSTNDDTEKINEAIAYLNKIGGGTLLFSEGVYNVRTVHLKSNVYLYLNKGATIKAMKGADAPETTWFSDKKYRSGLSPTDTGPYADPENYLTKQDVGHHYFRNSMFFGERLDNIKIIGNGYITGNGNLVTGDNVMRNAPDNRADKMFTLKLCTNLEIGGIYREEDLWYDSARDEPYYILKDGSKDFNTDNMLHIDRGGHFVLLATGTDNIHVHNTYFAKQHETNARDIYDFMQCNNVIAFNIYSKVSSDDIIKPGSDCSLGFTRPARNYKVRNVTGDTNCNLFQIGSETADDITDIHVDNIYVLGANKAGFSISTNDGANIKDIHLNCGHTGRIHSRSKMLRAYAPFFISISNRGRILGATVARYKFDEEGVKHDELLVTNVNIGSVENIIINGIDVLEVYGGSSYGGRNGRWKAYDGTQRRATPIIAGYKLPDSSSVEGGLNFKLPNGNHTGYIRNIEFNDVNILVKGGNPLSDTAANPPELGVGQYNASNLKLQPSYGLWARHVKGLSVKESSFNFEKPDSRYVFFLEDVIGASIAGIEMVKAKDSYELIKLKNSNDVRVENVIYYREEWGKSSAVLERK